MDETPSGETPDQATRADGSAPARGVVREGHGRYNVRHGVWARTIEGLRDVLRENSELHERLHELQEQVDAGGGGAPAVPSQLSPTAAAFLPPPAHLGGGRGTAAAAAGPAARTRAVFMEADYYARLGVQRSASDKEIKNAYRKQARLYHPDVNPSEDAKEKFQTINEAYAVLSDESMRARYDQFGEAGVKGAGGAPKPTAGEVPAIRLSSAAKRSAELASAPTLVSIALGRWIACLAAQFRREREEERRRQ